jgi:Uma2 family endonuclease
MKTSNLAPSFVVRQRNGMVEVLEPVELQMSPAFDMDDEQFYRFCRLNSDYRFERTANGTLQIMSPESASSGSGSAELIHYFVEWAHKDGTGRVFGSSVGYTLPKGSIRSPDVSWVLNSRLKKLSDRDWNRFLPLCPDFALELLSPTDRLPLIQDKMREYIANGARLAWLLDPFTKKVHIYKPRATPKILNNPREVSGDPILKGFKLELGRVWKAMER